MLLRKIDQIGGFDVCLQAHRAVWLYRPSLLMRRKRARAESSRHPPAYDVDLLRFLAFGWFLLSG